MDFSEEIKGRCLEYIDDVHMYLVDGMIVPSITQILKHKFGGKYSRVSKATLKKAADAGTAVHEAIENYCKTGEESELEELKSFKTLMSLYKFEVLENEVPIILFDAGIPVAAGRMDLVLKKDEETGIADIKRTYTLDKEYLAYQLNLYRIGYQQCYDTDITFLGGLHLREKKKQYVDIPINEDMAMDLVHEFMKGANK